MFSASAQEEDGLEPDDAPDVPQGGVVSDFYDLVAAAPEARNACSAILAALNQPKLVNDTWSLLVGTPYNYIWQHSDDGETWADARTLADITPQFNTADRLSVDLNGDGTPETVFRIPTMIQGQMFTAVSIAPVAASGDGPANPAIEIEIKDVKPRPPLDITPRNIGGDFYFIDVLALDGRNYLIAASSIIGRGRTFRQPSALVFTVDHDMQLNAVCHFAANKRV